MKLISCFLIFFLIEMHNARRKSTPSNGIRIPLRKTVPKITKQTSVHARGNVFMSTQSFIDPYVDYGTYISAVSIGTPKQQFDVIFDTGGSTDFFLLSTEYDKCAENFKEEQANQLYNRSASSTYKQPYRVPKPQALEFASAWVFGFKAMDVIQIGSDIVTAEFLEVTRTSDADTLPVLGMGYHPTEGGIVTRICNATNGEQKFGMFLPRNKREHYGELFLCGTNPKKYYPNTIQYINALYPGEWFFQVKKVEMHLPGKEPLIISENNVGIADTGSNRIVVPSHAYSVLLNVSRPFFIGRNETVKAIDCDNTRHLPVLHLTLGNGIKLILTGEDYLVKHLYRSYHLCLFPFRDYSDERWILGESFFTKYYTIFDMANHRIGFAESQG